MSRELDVQVHEALGLSMFGITPHMWDSNYSKEIVLPYSTDFSSAMKLEPHMSYFNLRRLAPNLWQCTSAWCGNWFTHLCMECGCVSSDAETAPEAICLAYLAGRGENGDELVPLDNPPLSAEDIRAYNEAIEIMDKEG